VNPERPVEIAVVGKYIELQDAYKSIYESLIHAGDRTTPRARDLSGSTPRRSSATARSR
jgi:CTP synthase (UTP-ammonia lyase)